MSAIDIVNRVFREFKRYTGDGLPGEPTGAPLPVGDPQSGVHNPKKSELRAALSNVLADAEDAASRAEDAASSFVEVGTNFKAVTLLLADNNDRIGYSGSGADFSVAAGDIVTAQGFRYEAADSSATDQHVTTAGGVKLYALPSTRGFDLRQWGVSAGAANNAPAIQLAMTVAAAANRPLYLGAKGDVWPCTGVVMPNVAGKRLELTGEAKLLFSGIGYLNLSGTIFDVTYVSTAVAKGSKTLVVNNASGLAVGDMIAVEDRRDFSFSPSQHTGREAYHAGDFARIAAISSNTLILEEQLRDGYPALTTSKIYKINPVELITSTFEVEASDTPTAAAIISCCLASRLDLHVKGGNQYAAFFNRLWKSVGRGGRYIHTAPNTGNNYGLVVGNAQDCDFYDVYGFGTRRGIATGTGGGDAGVPMRKVRFHRGSSDNGDDTLGSFDFHGDTDDCSVIGHRATFFDIGGRSTKVIDCVAAPRGTLSPVSWTELAGGDFLVKNIKVIRPAGATFADVVSGRNGAQLAKIAENYSLTIDGVEVADGSGLTQIVGFLQAAVTPIRSSVFLDNVKILGGTVSSTFKALNSSVSNVGSHGAGVSPPSKLVVGNDCVWPFLNTHFWLLTSGTHTGCRISAPSTTFLTSFFVGSAASGSTAQAFSFVGYPFVPKVDCSPYGLTSAAGMLFFGVVDAATASTATANITTGKSTDTSGADRTLSARIEVSMNGAISA